MRTIQNVTGASSQVQNNKLGQRVYVTPSTANMPTMVKMQVTRTHTLIIYRLNTNSTTAEEFIKKEQKLCSDKPAAAAGKINR